MAEHDRLGKPRRPGSVQNGGEFARLDLRELKGFITSLLTKFRQRLGKKITEGLQGD